MKDKLDKLIANSIALHESFMEFRCHDQDVVLCADPDYILEIHVYKGLHEIAEMYGEEIVVDPNNTLHSLSCRNNVTIKVGTYTIVFFQLMKVEGNKTVFNKLLLENEELKAELEMLKSGNSRMRSY